MPNQHQTIMTGSLASVLGARVTLGGQVQDEKWKESEKPLAQPMETARTGWQPHASDFQASTGSSITPKIEGRRAVVGRTQ